MSVTALDSVSEASAGKLEVPATGGSSSRRLGTERSMSNASQNPPQPNMPMAAPSGTVQLEASSRIVNMPKAKESAYKELDKTFKDSAKFEKFVRNSVYLDTFLQQALSYVTAVVKMDDLGERAHEMDEEVGEMLMDMAKTYAQILMTESNYERSQQEKVFFEALYSLTRAVVTAQFDKKRYDFIDNEMGRIFRSDAFNLNKRHNDNARSQHTITCRELYSLRYEGDGFNNSKILAALHPRQRETSVHRFVNAHSPIISLILPQKPTVTSPPRKRAQPKTPVKPKRRSSSDSDEDEDPRSLIRPPVATASSTKDASKGTPTKGSRGVKGTPERQNSSLNKGTPSGTTQSTSKSTPDASNKSTPVR